MTILTPLSTCSDNIGLSLSPEYIRIVSQTCDRIAESLKNYGAGFQFSTIANAIAEAVQMTAALNHNGSQRTCVDDVQVIYHEAKRRVLHSPDFKRKLKAAAEECNKIFFSCQDPENGLAKRYTHAIDAAERCAISSFKEGNFRLAYVHILISRHYQRQCFVLYQMCSEAFIGYSNDNIWMPRDDKEYGNCGIAAEARGLTMEALKHAPEVLDGSHLAEPLRAPESVFHLKSLVATEEYNRICSCTLEGRSDAEQDVVIMDILGKLITAAQESGDEQLAVAFERIMGARKLDRASRVEGDGELGYLGG